MTKTPTVRPPTTHRINVEVRGVDPAAEIIAALYPADDFPAIAATRDGSSMLWFTIPDTYTGQAVFNVVVDDFMVVEGARLEVAGARRDLTYAGPIDAVDALPPHLSQDLIDVAKGAFCIPGAAPGIPYGPAAGDGSLIWTPAYLCFDAGWRRTIRQAHTARGYRTFLLNWRDRVYRDDFPDMGRDVALARQGCLELLRDGKVPVLNLQLEADRSTWDLAAHVAATTRDVVDAVMVNYEVNGGYVEGQGLIDVWDDRQGKWVSSDGDPSHCMTDAFVYARSLFPSKVRVVLHMTPGHGSLGADEIQWYLDVSGNSGRMARCVDILASQDDHFNDPVGTGRGFQSTCLRLKGRAGGDVPAAWAPMANNPIPNWAGEFTTSETYHEHWTEKMQRDFMQTALAQAPDNSGYTDGGY